MVSIQILSKILKSKSVDIVLNNDLTSEHFIGYEEHYNFIMNHYKKYGNVPDVLTFLDAFDDFEVVEVSESDKYLVEKINEEWMYSSLVPVLRTTSEIIQSNACDALDYLKSTLLTMKPVNSTYGVDIISQARERYEEYKKKKDSEIPWMYPTGFKELDDAINGLSIGEEFVVIVARTNQGKCLCKGTQVLMADGTLKNVEDVAVGDYVQSVNTSNKVLALHNGVSSGYKIIPKSGGKPFVVSENHVLTLYNKVTKSLVDIVIEDFLDLDTNDKNNYVLYRCPVDYKTRDLKVKPYVLGKWFESKSVRICNEYVNLYNLKKTKTIPIEYLTSDSEQRLELLAGLCDGLGSGSNSNGFELCHHNKEFMNSVCQLCNGLGFNTTLLSERVSVTERLFVNQFRLIITGMLKSIPIRTKKCVGCNCDYYLSDANLSDFDIDSVEQIEYYGFQCDGDERYLLSDNTVTHNTWILQKLLTHIWKVANINVGLISPEMSATQVGYRFDTLNEHFSNFKLFTGKDVGDYEDYINFLESGEHKQFRVATPLDFNNSVTVSKLKNFCIQNDIKILGIDGITYLTDERYKRGDNKTTSLTNISEDLMALSVELKIPIITVVQSNRTGAGLENGDVPELESIRDSDGISHNASKVISMRQHHNKLKLVVKKNRNGPVGVELTYDWDIDTGVFEYNPNEGEYSEQEETRSNYSNSVGGNRRTEQVENKQPLRRTSATPF